MAISKQKKAEVIAEISELLASSKMTVLAKYSGTSVKAMQQLRRQSKDSGTVIKVVKNRLFIQALSGSEKFKDIDTAVLSGQLIYAFNSGDEVVPAQNIAVFAKDQPKVEFVGGLNADGQLLSAEDMKALASLPSKEQLRAQLVGTISAPVSGFVNVLASNIRSVLNVLNAKAEKS
ncbi:50S ribosomal protein L10 [Candidatus Saccharibacteria bacterium]|nr:50S ribosomal protein L10 [Candidatus Saccharibacteria bacterium]